MTRAHCINFIFYRRLRVFFAGIVLLTSMTAAAASPGQEISVSRLSLYSMAMICGLLLCLLVVSRKLARRTAALHKSENHIRLMGEQLPDATLFQLTCSGDHVFRFDYISEAIGRALDIDRAQIMTDATAPLEHVYEADIDILKEAYQAGRETLAVADLKIRILTRSGILRWLHIKAVPHRENGSLIWDGVVFDISESKNIETELAEEKDNLEHLFEAVGDLLVVCDMDGKLLHTNPIVEQRLGYTAAELLEMSLFELYPEDCRKTLFEGVATLQCSQNVSCNQPLKMKTGERIPVDMNLVQGLWKHEPVIVGIARDIATRQETEHALQNSQQMFQHIMNTIPMAVFWTDQNSVYRGCNKTFLTECRLSSEEDVIGKTPDDLFETEAAAQLIAGDQQVIHTNRSVLNHIHSQTQPDGGIGWREISKIPMHDDAGTPVGVLGVWHDVTEKTRAQERLKHTLEDMDRFNQLMRGRERRTLQMKDEVNRLLKELGRPEKYKTTMENLG